MSLLKHIRKVGNSWALAIDKPLLDMLDITRETPLKITVHNGSLIVTPLQPGEAESDHKRRVREASAWVNEEYNAVFKRLA
jgi:antitoxin component of MazEF toxin-antitoxin module